MGDFVFDADKHEYWLDGVELPSVTHIVRFLHFDAEKGVDKAVRNIAAERGTRIHEACLAYDYEGNDVELDGDIVGHVEAYAAFCRDYKPEWRGAESPMHGTVCGVDVGGTPDRFGIIDGQPCVVDIKTGSNAIKNTVAVSAQTWAYAALIASQGLERGINRRIQFGTKLFCLGLKSDGKYSFKELDFAVGGDAFVSCLRIHQLMEGKR